MKKDDKLISAVKLVNEVIIAEYKRLEEISKTEEGEPIMVEGETTAGYFCQLMVDPKDVAKIMLDYNYPVWRVLEEDAPDGMWEDLGCKFGLAHVCSVDLWKTVKYPILDQKSLRSAVNALNAANIT